MCSCGSLLGAPLLPSCRGSSAGTGCRDSRPGAGVTAGFLVQGVPDAHIAGCYSQLRCCPKYQRFTLKRCSAISPRMLCRALVHRQQHEHAQIPRRFGIYQAAGAGACFWLHWVCFLFALPVPCGVAQHMSAGWCSSPSAAQEPEAGPGSLGWRRGL